MSTKEELGKKFKFCRLGRSNRVCEDVAQDPSYFREETEVAKFSANFTEENSFEVEFHEVERGQSQTIGRPKGTGEDRSLAFVRA